MTTKALAPLLIGLAAAQALAQPLARAEAPAQPTDAEAKGPRPPPGPIEVVVTGTRTPESSQRATVRTDVVTREEAERRGATNAAEALAGQLGVQVNPNAYGAIGSPSAIQIQGLDRDRVLVLDNGERVIGDVGGAIDLSELPLSDVSRIEVVAGPVSSLYGTSAIGGVVNILSAAPEHEGFSARARLEGRSRRGALLQGKGAYRRGDAWASLDASLQRQDGIAAREGSPDLAVPDVMQLLLGTRAGVKLGDRVDVQARGRFIRTATEGRQDQVVPGLGTYRIDLPEHTDRFIVHLTETLDLGGGSSLRMTAGRQWAQNESAKDRYDSPLDEVRRRSDILTSFEAITTLANGKRTWVLGARAESEDLEQTLTKTERELRATVDHDVVEVAPIRLGSGALYGQLAAKLHDKLTVMPGVRAEMHVRYGGVVAPRLAAAYRPTEQWTIRVSGGRGFRAPSPKELGFSFDHSIYGYRVIGNPDLSPETSWGISGDVAAKLSSGLSIRAGVFANWIDDLIDIDVAPTRSLPGVDDYTYRNVGAARTFGGQIDFAGAPASWLRAEAGYAYLWTRDDAGDRPLEGRPPHTVYAAARASLPWRLELALRFRGVTDAFIEEDVRSPGFSTLDARLGRPLWPSSLLYAGVLNALDTRRDPDRPGDQRPTAGRTLYLGLTAETPWETDP